MKMDFTPDQLAGRADARILGATDPYAVESDHPGFETFMDSEKNRGHMSPPYGPYGGFCRELWDAAFEEGRGSMGGEEMLAWNTPELREWSIVGMNHYRVGGMRHLYVAMTRGSHCIQAESEMEPKVFMRLTHQAKLLNPQIDLELLPPAADVAG